AACLPAPPRLASKFLGPRESRQRQENRVRKRRRCALTTPPTSCPAGNQRGVRCSPAYRALPLLNRKFHPTECRSDILPHPVVTTARVFFSTTAPERRNCEHATHLPSLQKRWTYALPLFENGTRRPAECGA